MLYYQRTSRRTPVPIQMTKKTWAADARNGLNQKAGHPITKTASAVLTLLPFKYTSRSFGDDHLLLYIDDKYIYRQLSPSGIHVTIIEVTKCSATDIERENYVCTGSTTSAKG